jgi:DNA-binding transcriptional LysR family regulator
MNRAMPEPTGKRRGAVSSPLPDRASAGPGRLSLRQLEAFCAVAMTGSVSAAAVRMHRTQSAVSSAVAELEAALGAPLFERAGRGLRQTDAARRLLPRALEVIERAAELPALALGAQEQAERLRVGASRTIGPFLMPELLARFGALRPQASVDLAVANTAELVARLHRLELDLAFVEGDTVAPGMSMTEWMPDALCLFARAGHPLAGRFAAAGPRPPRRAYVAALAQARWALREPGSGTLETFLRAAAPAMGAPRIGITVDDPLALQRIVASGDWLGCMSRRAVADALADGSLVELPAPDAAMRRALTRRFWVLRLPERYRTAAVDALLALALSGRAGPGTPDATAPAGPATPAAAPRSAPGRRSRR